MRREIKIIDLHLHLEQLVLFYFKFLFIDDNQFDDPELRTKQSWSRFEYLKSENTGPKVESRYSTVEPKVLSEAARPKTSTSAKRKLTIHDLA